MKRTRDKRHPAVGFPVTFPERLSFRTNFFVFLLKGVEIIEAMACQTARVLLLVLLGHSLYIIYVIKFNASDLCVQKKIINSDVDSILLIFRQN